MEDASYYDSVFTSSPAYAKDCEETPWSPLWRWAANQIPKRSPGVLDLGCGPGHFIELARRMGVKIPIYIGIDFSSVALKQARARDLPNTFFCQVDITPKWMKHLRPGLTVVATEFLEHVEEDLEILQALPLGAVFVGTVPTFDTKGHVRHFPTIEDVRERYGPVFHGTSIIEPIGPRHYGICGVR